MKTLSDTGVWYTQNVDDIPIEERVFFREAIGENADTKHYRIATTEELDAWRAYIEDANTDFWMNYFAKDE